MLIILSFIANIDSFFISCLTAGKRRSNIVLITFSPVIHAAFCYAGILLQHQILFTYYNRLLLCILVAILVFPGLYLFFTYHPAKVQPHKTKDTKSIKPIVLMILLLFCSFDAIVAGIVFAYWKINIPESLIFVFIVNLLMILAPIIFSACSKTPVFGQDSSSLKQFDS